MQDNNAAFVATMFFALFCLYLLLAAIIGNLKIGVRFIFCCMSIHPMKKDKTYMNAFLFIILLILLCSVSVTQFCAASFADYSAMTDIDLIFTVQIRYPVFFVYFYKYHIFEYDLFGIAVLSFIVLLFRPRDNTVENIVNLNLKYS
jgi:LMBR1 domain-containing protein 1